MGWRMGDDKNNADGWIEAIAIGELMRLLRPHVRCEGDRRGGWASGLGYFVKDDLELSVDEAVMWLLWKKIADVAANVHAIANRHVDELDRTSERRVLEGRKSRGDLP